MFEYFLGILIVAGYFFIVYHITRLVRKWVNPKNLHLKILVLSFSYALFFGIGILGSGGDPGFAFPFPIILVGALDVFYWVPIRIFINGFLIPLALWWAVIFVVLIIKDWLNRKVRTKELIN